VEGGAGVREDQDCLQAGEGWGGGEGGEGGSRAGFGGGYRGNMMALQCNLDTIIIIFWGFSRFSCQCYFQSQVKISLTPLQLPLSLHRWFKQKFGSGCRAT
jgi:hypothetical protein